MIQLTYFPRLFRPSQVKVWFQNRRTKHKRTQQEDGDSKSGNKSTGSPKNFDSDDGEMMDDCDEIDIEDDEDNMAWKLFYQEWSRNCFWWDGERTDILGWFLPSICKHQAARQREIVNDATINSEQENATRKKLKKSRGEGREAKIEIDLPLKWHSF